MVFFMDHHEYHGEDMILPHHKQRAHATNFGLLSYMPSMGFLKDKLECNGGGSFMNCKLDQFGREVQYCKKFCGALRGLKPESKLYTQCKIYDKVDIPTRKNDGFLFNYPQPYLQHNQMICCRKPPNIAQALLGQAGKMYGKEPFKSLMANQLNSSMECKWTGDVKLSISSMSPEIILLVSQLPPTDDMKKKRPYVEFL